MKKGKVSGHSGKWIAGVSILAVLLVLLAVYLVFAVYFQKHFSFHTMVNHVSVSGASAAKTEKKIAEEMKGYELVLNEREDQTEKIKGADIDIAPSFHGEVQDMLKKQNAFAWPYYLIVGQSLSTDAVITYDEEKLDAVIDALDCIKQEGQKQSENAKISEYTEDGYQIIPEVYGTQIDRDKLVEKTAEAVSELKESLDLSEEGCYEDPAITSESKELVAAQEKMNRYVNVTITYDVDDNVEKLDAEEIHNWLSVDDKAEVSIDEVAVAEYVRGLAKKYNTVYRQRTLDTSYGQTVSIQGGDYGWKIDNDAEKEMILADLEAGEDVEREPVYAQTANSHGAHDYGNTYVEINLTAQHLYFYKKGSLLVDSDFVSGDTSKGHNTPVGAYAVTYKQKDATLRGPGYESKVTYWMPYCNDVGMHDATWRGDFGGSIYKRNGSHGCVNLPASVAKTIFENIEAGYPVLVYELPGTESAKGIAQDAAAAADAAIKAIGEVTLESEPAITAARASYDALDETAKSYVKNLDILTAAEAAYAQLQQQAAEQQAQTDAQMQAQAVIDQITGLGTVTKDSKAGIDAARSAYDALSDMAKAYVSNYADLEKAESDYKALTES